MVGRYEVSDLDVEDILVFAPNAHVDLGYTPHPSQFELEQEILAGVHTNPHGEIGCPVCGCIDLFLKERTAKGVRYRCMSCMYATESEFESVKSRKDITLAQFGLGFECAICGEDIDSYNHDTVMRHVRKCRQNQNQNFEAPYQPSQTLADYSPEMLKYSSTVTGDFFWDSLKFGQTTRNAEENQSDLYIWDEEAGLFYDYIEVPQPDGELIVVYWIFNEELDQVGKAQISLFNNNLEIDSIFIEPYYQRRGIATSFVNHVVNYWDSELLTFSDTVSDEGVAFVDSFAAEDSLKVYRRMSWEQYFDALDTGYLMPTKMRKELDGFVSNKSWSISDRFNTSRTPLFDSPLAHLQADVLPIFEIELLPEDKLEPTFENAKKGSYPVIDVMSAIPVERVTPFSTSEELLSFTADNWTLELFEKPDFMGNRGKLNVQGEQIAPEGTIVYRSMPSIDYDIAFATGFLPSPEPVGFLKNFDYAVFTSFSPTPTRFQSSQSYAKDELEYPIYEIDISGLRVFITEHFLNNQGIVVVVLEPISVDRITPLDWDDEYKLILFRAEDNYDATYGVKQAKIRRRLKKKIKKQAIMGTKAGQWSARKSQELKRQYEAACQRAGLKPYKGQKTKKQQDLTDWSKQDWRTASGKKSSTTGEPYFPAKAVAALKQKGLYAKAKKQKQAATKAGKQNARYSDDIRKVVAKYRAEGINMKKLDYYQNVLDKSVFPFIDVEWKTGDETIAEKLTKKDYSWQDEVEWTSWTPDESKLSKTFVFTDDDPWVELWNLVFFADALSEASGVDIESVVNQNRVQITIEKTQTPIDFVLLEYINEYMRL